MGCFTFWAFLSQTHLVTLAEDIEDKQYLPTFLHPTE
jgi:hypothetical protein